jgi:hypothetical protein
MWRLGYGITTARAEVIYARWMQVNTGWSRVLTVTPRPRRNGEGNGAITVR